jgi:hypothetical protein
MLDILVPKIGLQSSYIVPLVRQSKSAGMSQHKRICFEAEACGHASPLNHPRKLHSGAAVVRMDRN